MSEEKVTIIDQARDYVSNLFLEKLDVHYVFHNFSNTEELLDQATELAEESGVSAKELEHLQLATLFFDTGYTESYDEPLPASVAIAEAWLKENKYAARDIEAVTALMRDSQTDEPSTETARLLHDARLSWLGRKRFERRAELLRLEQEYVNGEKINSQEWARQMLDQLMGTRYLTAAGAQAYGERRVRNVADQRSNLSKVNTNAVKRKTGKNFGRGIDTLYRTSFRNHINLSRIADGKANMMISINTIILSILLAVSGAGIGFFEEVFFQNPIFILPILILILSSLIAVVFAVFSARPKVTEYKISKKDIKPDREASLLYFGNFLQLEKATFVDYLADVKLDQTRLYDDLSRDLYDLGQVLHRKYLLLTISYNTFVGGLILSVLSFLVIYLFIFF